MAFSSIQDQNPFVLPGLFFLAVLLARQYFVSRPGRFRPYAQKLGRRSVMVLGALLGVCVVLVPAFEAYFRVYECEVSQQYMHENVVLARKAIAVLTAHGIPFWLDYATLLNQLRSQQLNRWEQDADMSVLHPSFLESLRDMPVLANGGLVGPALDKARQDPQAPGLPLSTQHLIQKFQDEGFQVTYSLVDGRELLQMWGPVAKGPHVDLWMWAPGVEGTVGFPTAPSSTTKIVQWSASSPPLLYTGEHATFNPRPWAAIFPLQPAKWLGMDITLPADPHRLSQGEFGRYGGSYMVAQVFRGDCFHNFFQLRFAY